jgi:ribosomal-protein-alanine N-acetyltransferase
MTVIIETGSIRNLDRLYEIEKECFQKEAFTRQQIASLLTDYNSISLIAKEESQITGFIIGMIYIERHASVGHILTIDILPKHRQKGTGLKLLAEIENIFREKGVRICYLEVREDNKPALKLYAKMGYKEVGKLKNYYGDAHGLYLEKELT